MERRAAVDPLDGGRRAHPAAPPRVAGVHPRATDRLRPFMREVVNGLVDAVRRRAGGASSSPTSASRIPIPIICELLGAPKEDWKLFSGWATDIFRIFNNDIANDLARIEAAMRRARRLRAGDGRGAAQPSRPTTCSAT